MDKLLRAGFVRPSTSPWSSPVIPVPKRDGGVRLVVDYQEINKLTHGQVDIKYPLPRLDELLARPPATSEESVPDMQNQENQSQEVKVPLWEWQAGLPGPQGGNR